MKDLATAWVGHGRYGGTAYRLDLSVDGGGLLASVDTYSEPQFYRVTKWSVAGRLLTIDAVSEAHPEESLHISGKAWLDSLDLQVKAKWRLGSDKWDVRFFPEAVTLKNYEALKGGMLKYAQARP